MGQTVKKSKQPNKNKLHVSKADIIAYAMIERALKISGKVGGLESGIDYAYLRDRARITGTSESL